jgi:Fur family ferric uptake transcriptional regulator
MVKIDVWQAVLRILDSYLEMNNHRKTPERYTILKAIYKTEGHFTLDELSEQLVKDYNFPVSRATLYNTLNLFLQLRLVIRHRFQGSTVYEACYDNMSHSHQICTVCGKVTEVKSQGVIDAINKMPTRRFHKDGFTLYVYGICSSCQTKMRRHTAKGNETKKVQKSK